MSEVEAILSRLRYFGVFPWGRERGLSPLLLAISGALSGLVLSSGIILLIRGPLVSSRMLYRALYYSRQLVKASFFPLAVLSSLASRTALLALLGELSQARSAFLVPRPSPPPNYKLVLHTGLITLSALSVTFPYLLYGSSPVTGLQLVLTFSALTAASGLTHLVVSCLSLVGAEFSALRLALFYFRLNSTRLEHVAVLHSRLCRLASRLNRALDTMVLIVVSLSFFLCVIYIYYVVFVLPLAGYSPEEYVIVFVHYISTAAVCFLFVESIVASSTYLSKQARDFNVSLYQLMLDDVNEISKNEKLRLHIAMQQKVNITAAGYFDVDYTLIKSMIGLTTTYLVILFQFDKADKRLHTPASDIANTTVIPYLFSNATVPP